MRKLIFTLVCLMALLPAVQSFAHDHSIGGFFRTRFITADLQKGKDEQPDTLVDQRARVKWMFDVAEDIQFVYYGEVDFQFGDAAYANSRNQGGGASGDSVNIETKNLYIKAKIPDTPLTATIGLQGYMDHADFAMMLGDMAGVRIDFGSPKDSVSGNVAWFKMFEGDGGANHTIGQADSEDDMTLLAAQSMFKPTGALTLNLDGYYLKSQKNTNAHPAVANQIGTKEDLYYITLSGKYALPMMDLSGWVMYGGGTSEDGAADGSDLSHSGWVATVKGSMPFTGGNTSLRGIFYSSDDDITDDNRTAIRIPWATDGVPVGLAVPFPTNGLMILLGDMFGTTYHTGGGFAHSDAAYMQYGLLGAVANVSYTPPSLPNLWLKGAAGYFQALEDDLTDASTKKEGKNIGTEVTARVGYKFGKFDVSLNGAYAFLGDFYDKTVDGENPDDPYQVYAMVNVPF